jgi:hypothetical protein
LVKGPFSVGAGEGVSIEADGRRLVFGCDSAAAEDIMEYAARFIPEQVVRTKKPKLII